MRLIDYAFSGEKLMRGTFLVLFSLLAAAPTVADEGMWPYNRIPADQVEQAHGVELDGELLHRLQRASVRFNNGGSGSFVSPSGLAMTNHHVAADCIEKVSSEDNDYIGQGFYAAKPGDELSCPDLELNVLLEIESVTDRVNAGVNPEMDEAAVLDAQKASIAGIEKACKEATGERCDVVKLYQGGIFDLYKYKRYTDVRLIFAPESQTAYYGGDPDNFNFPRWCLDVAFLRVYEDGKPIESPAFLPWSEAGASQGETVFVSGHPGTTNRLLTYDQLLVMRDIKIPSIMRFLEKLIGAVGEYGKQGGDAERQARDELFSLNNAWKAYTGRGSSLADEELLAQKKAEENKLRKEVDSVPDLSKKYSDAWKEIAKAQEINREVYEPYRLVGGRGVYSRYVTIATTLYRMSTELRKPNGERLEEFQDAGLQSLERRLYSPAPIYPELEIVKLGASLGLLRDELGADDALVKRLLAGKEPDGRAKELVEGTKLADVEFRKQLGADKAAKAAESDDPMMQLAAALDGTYRKLRKRYEDEVEAAETANGGKIAQARFAVEGEDVYPDATFTLRLAVGTVKSYYEDGKRVHPFTNFKGLYDRAAAKENAEPYHLTKRMQDAQEKVDLTVPYNLASTNDITGGNSGSPLVNADAHVVGIIFDGNIQSLGNDYLYSETQARAVSVDSRAILHALERIYSAKRVADELKATRH